MVTHSNTPDTNRVPIRSEGPHTSRGLLIGTKPQKGDKGSPNSSSSLGCEPIDFDPITPAEASSAESPSQQQSLILAYGPIISGLRVLVPAADPLYQQGIPHIRRREPL